MYPQLAGGLSVVPHIIIVATLSSFPVLIINAVAVIATTVSYFLLLHNILDDCYVGDGTGTTFFLFCFSDRIIVTLGFY